MSNYYEKYFLEEEDEEMFLVNEVIEDGMLKYVPYDGPFRVENDPPSNTCTSSHFTFTA